MNLPRPRRLRTRVTLVASAAVAAVMGLAALAMIDFQQRQLFDAVDVALTESVSEISDELDVSFGRDGDRDEHAEPGTDLRRVTLSKRPLQLLDLDGNVLASSSSLTDEAALIDPDEALDDPSEGVGEYATVETESGTRYRISATAVDEGVLVAAYSLADVDRSLRILAGTLLIAIPALAGIVGFVIWQVLGRALKPVEAIREEVATIGASELDRRVPVPDHSIELESLANTMNAMLDRLDQSAERQNRFVSDAAHELRSPLAGIRGQLEVNIHHPEAPERAESEKAMLAEAVRMQSLVDDLLVLARADQGRLEVAQTEVDLDDVVLDEAQNLRRRAEVAVRADQVSAAQVLGDAAQLRRVVRNLADNAARFARSTVSFELAENATMIHLAVVDDGPGIAAGEEEAVFDRFTRLDEARGRDEGGSGLGLAICREIVEAHRGTIAVDGDHDGGARFLVTLPRP